MPCGKTQCVRLVDVFLLGPFMMWAGYKSGALPTWAKWTLALSGLATVAYNLNNYLRIQREGNNCNEQ